MTFSVCFWLLYRYPRTSVQRLADIAVSGVSPYLLQPIRAKQRGTIEKETLRPCIRFSQFQIEGFRRYRVPVQRPVCRYGGRKRQDSTVAFYGKYLTVNRILKGKVVAPADARPFLAEVRREKSVTASKW
jgi:hypothetical protein